MSYIKILGKKNWIINKKLQPPLPLLSPSLTGSLRKSFLARLCMFTLCMPVLLEFHVLIGAMAVPPSYEKTGSDLGLQVFLQTVQQKPHENVVLSPHGVATILAILLPGTHGNTKQQLLSGLRYNKKGKRIGFLLKLQFILIFFYVFCIPIK